MYDIKPVPGNRSLIVTDRARKRYRLNFIGDLLQSPVPPWRAASGRMVGGSLSCVSKGDSVIVRDVVHCPNPCIIKDIQYQTPAMDQADAAAMPRPRRQR